MRILFLLFLFIFSNSFQNLQAQTLDEHESKLRLYRSQQRWVKASEELKTILDKSSPEEREARSSEAAEAFFKARVYKEAARYYQLLSERLENQNDAKILDRLTSAYARSSQFDKALENLGKLQSLPSQNDQNLAYRKIFILYDSSRCKEAVSEIDSYLALYPKSTKNDEALWMKIFCQKNLNHIREALESLETYQKKYPESAARVSFWKSRWNLLIKENKEASLARQELLNFDGFYSQWENRKKHLDAKTCLHTSVPFTKKPAPPPPSKKNKNVVWIENNQTLSEDEIREILRTQETEVKRLKVDSFNEWIQSLAKIRKVPPALIYAIMYEESRFKPKAASDAGALGLMQMIPETGFEVAAYLNRENFHFNELMDPWTNSNFGITYLAILLEKFSGNLVYTIAAYNAGPDAVERWIDLRKNETCEEWMDQIPFRETYNYVQKVLKSMWRFEKEKPSVLPELTQPIKA